MGQLGDSVPSPQQYTSVRPRLWWVGFLNYTKSLPQYQRDLTASNKFTIITNSFGGRVYVSGFNEEGFAVSAAGLTDLQTGETLSPEGIGSDARDPNEPTVFNGDVVVNGTLEAQKIDSKQVSLVKNLITIMMSLVLVEACRGLPRWKILLMLPS